MEFKERNPSDDLVILVHGTFAGSNDDVGDAWWQQGSETWTQLQAKLPHGIRLAEQGEVFHWSGDNQERARIKAAHDLLDRLLALEEEGKSYHLVGHSHGGSVIWGALRLATLDHQTLKGLQSWATVGTPFMHYQMPRAFSLSNFAKLVLAITFLRPVFSALYGLGVWIKAALFGGDVNMILAAEKTTGFNGVIRAPFLKLMEVLGVANEHVSGGLKIGTFDPTGSQTFFEYMFLSREGLTILATVLLFMFVFAHLSTFLLSPLLETLRIRGEKRMEQKTTDQFGGRWLGLWSPEDEAINGLRATLDISLSFISRMAPRERVFFSDNASLLSRPYFWIFAPVFNNFLRPLLDTAMRTRVIKTAQGNNRPAAVVSEVLPAPRLLAEGRKPPPLPAELNQQIVDRANMAAGGIAPKLRQLLAQPSFTGSLGAFGKSISGKELVHTSYFDHEAVLTLLVYNIAWSKQNLKDLSQHDDSGQLAAWFQDFKSTVGIRPSYVFPSVQRRPLIEARRAEGRRKAG